MNATNVNGINTWQSQAIIANSRTDSMFKHIGRFTGSVYSYLATDTWKNKLPAFTNTANLFTTTAGGSLYELKKFTIATVDTGEAGNVAMLPDWRLVHTTSAQWLYPDWPIPVNLTYSDADLQTAGIGGFPLGDSNWFPARKAFWDLQRATELTTIETALSSGGLVPSTASVDWQESISVRDNCGSSGSLSFGLAGGATDNIDAGLGEVDLPPLPVTGAFDARFTLPISPPISSNTDIRS